MGEKLEQKVERGKDVHKFAIVYHNNRTDA
jgi:hypothetical protein